VSRLAGSRILLVEDEAIIAFALEDILEELGCTVVGPAMHLDEALALARCEAFDAAILDVNLNDARSYPVAAEIERRGMPFVFASGYDPGSLEWSGRPVELLSKPYRKDQVEAALSKALL
jgi:CheY-like chemotaxis protein